MKTGSQASQWVPEGAVGFYSHKRLPVQDGWYASIPGASQDPSCSDAWAVDGPSMIVLEEVER